MGHQVQHAVALQHALARLNGDVVAGFHGDLGIDLDVRIHDDHVAHLARAHVMHIAHAGGVDQGLADGLYLLLVH